MYNCIGLMHLCMGRITFTADEEHEEIVAEVKESEGLSSTSKGVRVCIERAARLEEREAEMQHEYAHLERRAEDLQNRLESREDRIDDLEEQLGKRSEIEEKVDVLAKQVEGPDPPFWVRWKRWFGRDGED